MSDLTPRDFGRRFVAEGGAQHWSVAAAVRVLELFPNRELYTCAAGISPSGIVHSGNLRDVMTTLMVVHQLRKQGRNVEQNNIALETAEVK